jgi:hypothetical protein
MKSKKNVFKSLVVSLFLLLAGALVGGVAVYNYFSLKNGKNYFPKGNNLAINFDPGNYQNEAAAYLKFKAIKEAFIPSGVPDTYGRELGISFDKVQDAINKVRVFGPTYGQGKKKITLADLTESELKRYKKIGSSIACEYCCGAKTLTLEDGTAACGCAHSIMMRGLAAYLVKNHSQEFSDEQILEELTKWKRAYFPKQTLSAELARLAKEGEPGIEQILKEFPDFLPQMVGGC